MDQNIPMSGGMPEAKEPTKKPVGAIVSIIIIVVLLALGALYSLKQVPTAPTEETLTPAEIQADTTVSSLSTQGTSTNIEDIAKDVNATDFDVDLGLGNVNL